MTRPAAQQDIIFQCFEDCFSSLYNFVVQKLFPKMQVAIYFIIIIY